MRCELWFGVAKFDRADATLLGGGVLPTPHPPRPGADSGSGRQRGDSDSGARRLRRDDRRRHPHRTTASTRPCPSRRTCRPDRSMGGIVSASSSSYSWSLSSWSTGRSLSSSRSLKRPMHHPRLLWGDPPPTIRPHCADSGLLLLAPSLRRSLLLCERR